MKDYFSRYAKYRRSWLYWRHWNGFIDWVCDKLNGLTVAPSPGLFPHKMDGSLYSFDEIKLIHSRMMAEKVRLPSTPLPVTPVDDEDGTNNPDHIPNVDTQFNISSSASVW